jgi:hypothetical protein
MYRESGRRKYEKPMKRLEEGRAKGSEGGRSWRSRGLHMKLGDGLAAVNEEVPSWNCERAVCIEKGQLRKRIRVAKRWYSCNWGL